MTAAMIPTMATDYNFGGTSPGNFAKPTSVEPEIIIGSPADENSNINRSKDNTIVPPSFGRSASNTPDTGEPLTPNISGVTIIYGNNSSVPMTVNPGNSGVVEYQPISSVNSDIPPQTNVSHSSYAHSSNKFTTAEGMFYDDGSIGSLSIPKLNVSGKVYEEESLENMSRGIGHFRFTSAWDGNVGFAAHNRGISVAFGQIHTLRNGDKIVYTTKYGTRTYEVFYVGQIRETDFSRLERTSENIVTLITCVNDVPELRWCVQAREVS